MPLRNDDCHTPMDGEGMDAQITSGNEVRKRRGEVETSQFWRVYFKVPNALRDETHLTSSPAYCDAETQRAYTASLLTLSHLPSAVERLKQNRPHQHANPTAKPI